MSKISKFIIYAKLSIMLLLIHFGLVIFGYRRVFYFVVDSFPTNLFARRFNDVNQIKKALGDINNCIAACCSIAPFKAECMHQSFLAYYLIRRHLGIPVDIMIGVNKFPFTAHAWVALNGKNIFENDNSANEMSIILSSRWGEH